jgi:hypothetical protein
MGLLNHLTASWLWSDPGFLLNPLRTGGPYRAFLVVPAAGLPETD